MSSNECVGTGWLAVAEGRTHPGAGPALQGGSSSPPGGRSWANATAGNTPHLTSRRRSLNIPPVSWDLWLLQHLNGLAGRSAALDTAARLVARFGSVAEVLLALLLPVVAGWRGVTALPRLGTALLLATGLVRLLQHSLPRQRPFVAGSVQQLVARRPGPSFPSRHVASAFALAVPAWRAHRAVGSAMLVVGALLALSRVYSGLHYPTDVLAGAAVGIGCGRLVSNRRRASVEYNQ